MDWRDLEGLQGARFSAPVQTGPGAHPASYTMGTGPFPGVKRPESGFDHRPHTVPRLKKEKSYTSTPLWTFAASTRMKITFTFIPVKLGVGLLTRLGVGQGFKPVGAK